MNKKFIKTYSCYRKKTFNKTYIKGLILFKKKTEFLKLRSRDKFEPFYIIDVIIN